jgi:hypothetical protein
MSAAVLLCEQFLVEVLFVYIDFAVELHEMFLLKILAFVLAVRSVRGQFF